jgi:hypothetical protein
MVKYIVINVILYGMISVLIGCSHREAFFFELKSVDFLYKTRAQYSSELNAQPQRMVVDKKTGIETWAWDTSVTHNRRVDAVKEWRAWHSYPGKSMPCTYEVDFDPQGRRLDSRFIGAGCFDSSGRLYDEFKWSYDGVD